MESVLSVAVGLGLLPSYPWWGKLRLLTSRSRPSFLLFPKAIATSCLSAVASCWRSFLNPPPGSVGLHRTTTLGSLAATLRLFVGRQPTATARLAPYCLLSLAGIPSARWLRLPPSLIRSSDLSSVTPSGRIALLLRLLSIALDQCNNLHGSMSGYSGPTVAVFSPVGGHLPTPLRPAFVVSPHATFTFLRSLLKGLGLSTYMFLCIISLHVWGILS